MRDLPEPGIKPVFPAFAGRFLFSVPPGKSFLLFYKGRMQGGGIPLSVIPHGGWLADASCSRNFDRTKPFLALEAIPKQEEESYSTPCDASLTLFNASPLYACTCDCSVASVMSSSLQPYGP